MKFTHLSIGLVCSLFLFILPANGEMDYNPHLDQQLEAGFLGITWGAELSSIPEMQKVGSDMDEGVDFYARKKDSLAFEGIGLSKIDYGFIDGNFMSVALHVQGHENYRKLKQWAFEKYGQCLAVHNDDKIEECALQGQKSYITLNYFYPEETGFMLVVYSKSAESDATSGATILNSIK